MKDYPEVNVALLNKRIQELEIQNAKYKKLLVDNEVIEEDVQINEVEIICVSEIKKLKDLSEGRGLDLNDVKMLDILHKNLLQARGSYKEDSKKKTGPKDVAELLRIVEKGN